MRKRRWLVGLGIILVGMLLWLLVPGGSQEESVESSESATADIRLPPSEALNAILNAPLPESRGALSISGRVTRDGAPVAGALVIATGEGSSAGADVLSELPCACDN